MSRRLFSCSTFSLVVLVASWAVAQSVPSFTPLNDLGTCYYLGQFQGGLYPGGVNAMPAAHADAGLAAAAAIIPRNTFGQPDANGRYALISVGMSNTTQEFCSANAAGECAPFSFMGQAMVHPAVNQEGLAILNGAEGGKSAAFWDSPTDTDYNRVRDQVLGPAGLSELQVEAAWVKVANPGPQISLPSANADAYLLVQQMGDIARALKVRYTNLQQVFLSSRTYGGYANTSLNPEPYAYESGLAVKWLIEAQINQMNGGGVDPLAGDLDYGAGTAPWLAWGPYLWADGSNPRSDGLFWDRSDFGGDGTHPSTNGRTKVASELLEFFLSDPNSQPWFLGPAAGDYDEDGNVDGNDFLAWQRGESTSPLSSSELAVWRARFGNGSLVADATPVQEPSSTALLLLAGLICWRTGISSAANRQKRF